jgi:hypothetical protein
MIELLVGLPRKAIELRHLLFIQTTLQLMLCRRNRQNEVFNAN